MEGFEGKKGNCGVVYFEELRGESEWIWRKKLVVNVKFVTNRLKKCYNR